MHKKGKQVLSEMYKNTSVFLRIDKYKKAEHRTKDEKDRVVSTDAEKACDQRVQHSFKIKMLNSLEMDDLREHKKGRI